MLRLWLPRSLNRTRIRLPSNSVTATRNLPWQCMACHSVTPKLEGFSEQEQSKMATARQTRLPCQPLHFGAAQIVTIQSAANSDVGVFDGDITTRGQQSRRSEHFCLIQYRLWICVTALFCAVLYHQPFLSCMPPWNTCVELNPDSL